MGGAVSFHAQMIRKGPGFQQSAKSLKIKNENIKERMNVRFGFKSERVLQDNDPRSYAGFLKKGRDLFFSFGQILPCQSI